MVVDVEEEVKEHLHNKQFLFLVSLASQKANCTNTFKHIHIYK